MSDLADLAAAVGLGDDPPSHDYHHQPQMMMQPGNSNAFDEPEDHHVTHHHHLEHHDDSVEPEPIMVNHSDLHDHHDQDRHGGQHHREHHSVHHGNEDSEHHDDDVQNDMLADHDATLREAVTADIDPSKVDPLTLAQHKEQIFIKLYKDKAIEAALLKKKLEQKSQEVKSLKAQLAALRKSSKSYFANGGSARMGEEPKAVPTATEATMDDKKPAATTSTNMSAMSSGKSAFKNLSSTNSSMGTAMSPSPFPDLFMHGSANNASTARRSLSVRAVETCVKNELMPWTVLGSLGSLDPTNPTSASGKSHSIA
jgi:myosin heavy subunit